MPARRRDVEMGFFGHLEILRRRILASFVVFLVSAVAVFAAMDRLMPLLTGPAARCGITLYALAPHEKLVAYMKASALAGLIIALPVAAALGASFVAPALEPGHRRLLAPGLVIVFFFVLAGIALSWLVMVPFAIGFFARFSAGDGIEPLWGLGSYISLVSGLVASAALVCLIPPVLLALIGMGVLDVRALARKRRHAIVAIVAVAAVLTPTVDVVTQCAVGALMWALFEITLLLGRMLAPRGDRRRAPPAEALDGQT